MTKLCCFCQDNSHLSVFKRHAEAAESERVHRENEWPQALQIWTR